MEMGMEERLVGFLMLSRGRVEILALFEVWSNNEIKTSAEREAKRVHKLTGDRQNPILCSPAPPTRRNPLYSLYSTS